MNELVKIDVSNEYTPRVYVYKREKGWHWKFKLPNGKWFYMFVSKDEGVARKNSLKKASQLAKGLFTCKELDKINESKKQILTFELAIEEYVEHLKLEGASPNYYGYVGTQLKAIASFFQGRRIKCIHKVTEEDAYNFRKHLLKRIQAKEITKVTGLGILNDVKRLFKWLKRRKKILLNPWLEVEAISVPKEERVRTITPSVDILPKLLSADYVHKNGFPIKEFAYSLFRTGSRKEELLFLEVDDVNWETGHWLIQPKSCPIKHGMEWSPKYGKSRETIIPFDVLEMLKPLVARAMSHKVVGYTPNKRGQMVPVNAGFIFTMIDRGLSKKNQHPVYRRVDSIRGAWGALFISAGLAEPKESSSSSTKCYKDGIKRRTDVRVAYTRHDMRRGFNLSAKEAGMSLEDRALILGHGRAVNESHYCGGAKLDVENISSIVNDKMWKVK